MKKLLTLATIAIIPYFAFCTVLTIKNSGFFFSPDTLTIKLGDTVNFQLGTIHNAVEVSKETWQLNGTTPLPGFSVPFGGGLVTDLKVGTHYYVCTPHASTGMKGIIQVMSTTEVKDLIASQNLRIFPNPAEDKLMVQFPIIHHEAILEIFDEQGRLVSSEKQSTAKEVQEVNLSGLLEGVYFIRITQGESKLTEKIVIQDLK